MIPGLKPNQPKNKASSYRPISLTSLIRKNMEPLVLNELVPFLERNGLISDKQHGFRRRRSCLSQLLLHQNMIIKALLEGKNFDSIYCDFQKAFDKCNINMSAHTLRRSGIQGKLGIRILDFMSNRNQYVLCK